MADLGVITANCGMLVCVCSEGTATLESDQNGDRGRPTGRPALGRSPTRGPDANRLAQLQMVVPCLAGFCGRGAPVFGVPTELTPVPPTP
jgi:hypothetical protein